MYFIFDKVTPWLRNKVYDFHLSRISSQIIYF